MNHNIMALRVMRRVDNSDDFILPPGALDAEIAQALAQHVAKRQGDRRMPRNQLIEILLRQHEQFRVHRRHHRGGARFAGQQGHFAEIAAAPQIRQHLVRIVFSGNDLHFAGFDDVQAIAGIIDFKNQRVFLKRDALQLRRDQFNRIQRQIAEHLDVLNRFADAKRAF